MLVVFVVYFLISHIEEQYYEEENNEDKEYHYNFVKIISKKYHNTGKQTLIDQEIWQKY